MKTYNVLTAVDHNNKRVDPGATINLEDEAAAPLLAVQAIELAAQQDTTVTVPSDPAERQIAIAAAIGKLDPGNTNLWLKDGRPDINAIAEITGWPVSAAERNVAWTQIQSAE